MDQKLSREELIDLVETIMSVRDKETGRVLTENECIFLKWEFIINI